MKFIEGIKKYRAEAPLRERKRKAKILKEHKYNIKAAQLRLKEEELKAGIRKQKGKYVSSGQTEGVSGYMSSFADSFWSEPKGKKKSKYQFGPPPF